MIRACGSILDSLEGDCYKLATVPVLKKFIEEGNTFDYVINDLTGIPLSTEPEEGLCSLSVCMEELGKLSCPVAFTKREADMPFLMGQYPFISSP
ncbi:hypothetical protein NQZ68_008802 [Dissostichus eleginoides]|nr:hypothetical protein NQZ68_008802 [Dissostichus eleginoides]